MDVVEFWRSGPTRNAYVDEPEFHRLYVRRGPQHLWFDDGTIVVSHCLQIANVEAKRPRNGAFGRLLERIDRELGCPVFVENIMRQAVAEGLQRKYSFESVNAGLCFCLYRPAP